MSDARTRILGTVRDSLLRAVLPDATAALERPGAVRPAPWPDARIMVDTFTSALEGLTGHVRRVATPADAAAAVFDIATEYGVAEYMSWDEAALGCPGIQAALASRGLRRVAYTVPAESVLRQQTMDALAGVGLGLTGADAALADTGALVLTAGPGRGRLASLLPPVHVAVVPVDRLVPSLGALFEARPGLLHKSSNVVVIAGPSRTADIEMTLTHGVHGPKHVYAVLVG
jgi:L-lactate dehydrogenase complex protein LldG